MSRALGCGQTLWRPRPWDFGAIFETLPRESLHNLAALLPDVPNAKPFWGHSFARLAARLETDVRVSYQPLSLTRAEPCSATSQLLHKQLNYPLRFSPGRVALQQQVALPAPLQTRRLPQHLLLKLRQRRLGNDTCGNNREGLHLHLCTLLLLCFPSHAGATAATELPLPWCPQVVAGRRARPGFMAAPLLHQPNWPCWGVSAPEKHSTPRQVPTNASAYT